ncbi:MAG: AsmA family protein, partial [Deltaproteobacteria bacterium]|nr:AsmA family protein [Deltaproteobacteria bacterium]
MVFLFLLGGLSLSTVAYFKLRDVKASLQEVLQSYINGKILIADAEVSFFPSGISLKGVELYAPEAKEAAAIIPEANLSFDLLPLLQKKLETSLEIQNPTVRLHQSRRGPSNMEQIFAPVLEDKKTSSGNLDELWWKRLAIDELTIRDGYFVSTQEGKKKKTELKKLNIQADHIRFDSPDQPADINISYQMAELSSEPLVIKSKMLFKEKEAVMALEEGAFLWGPIHLALGGQAHFPEEKQKEVSLDFDFSGKDLDLAKIQKFFKQEPSVQGKVDVQGKVGGSAYSPVISAQIRSAHLQAKDISIQDFLASLKKTKEPIELTQLSLKVFEGQVEGRGQFDLEEKVAANLKLKLSSLSVAAMSDKKREEMPALLNGDLHLKSSDVANPEKLTGSGPITVGPI